MKPLQIVASRREFLAATSGVLTTITSSAGNQAGELLGAAAAMASIVLHDPKLPMPAEISRRLTDNGARIIVIDQDPVRMWRQELGDILRHPDTKLFGLTRWADYLIVRGLAAESRRHPRFEQLNAETGHLTWLIA